MLSFGVGHVLGEGEADGVVSAGGLFGVVFPSLEFLIISAVFEEAWFDVHFEEFIAPAFGEKQHEVVIAEVAAEVRAVIADGEVSDARKKVFSERVVCCGDAPSCGDEFALLAERADAEHAGECVFVYFAVKGGECF